MEIIIYGKNGCQDCQKAKLLADMKGLKYKYVNVGVDISVEEFLLKTNGANSVPQVMLKPVGELSFH